MTSFEDLNHQLFTASRRGDLEALKALIAQTDPTFNNSIALQLAAEHGHADCVSLLIPVSVLQANNSHALRKAAINGHADCVRLLIPVSDLKADKSFALFGAASYGHADCVALLLPVSNPLSLDRNGLTPSDIARLEDHGNVADMIDAFIEAQALSESLPRHLAKPAPRASI